MANNKFLRRYRELEKYRMEKSPLDPTFEVDRMEVLNALSRTASVELNISESVIRPVNPPKYHGKIVRSKEYASQLRTKRQEDDARKHEFYKRQAQIKQTEENRVLAKELADSLKSFVTNRQSIPKKLLEDSPALRATRPSRALSPLPAQRGGGANNSPQPSPDRDTTAPLARMSITAYRAEQTVFPKLDYTMAATPLAYDRGRTSCKWTNDERSRMDEIYHEMRPPPPHAPAELLELYLNTFADRFCVFFPSRSKAEAIKKIKFMVRNKKLKEVGEEAYWEAMRPSRLSALK